MESIPTVFYVNLFVVFGIRSSILKSIVYHIKQNISLHLYTAPKIPLSQNFQFKFKKKYFLNNYWHIQCSYSRRAYHLIFKFTPFRNLFPCNMQTVLVSVYRYLFHITNFIIPSTYILCGKPWVNTWNKKKLIGNKKKPTTDYNYYFWKCIYSLHQEELWNRHCATCQRIVINCLYIDFL